MYLLAVSPFFSLQLKITSLAVLCASPALLSLSLYHTYAHKIYVLVVTKKRQWKVEGNECGRDKARAKDKRLNEHNLQKEGVKVKLAMGEMAGFYPQQPAGTN